MVEDVDMRYVRIRCPYCQATSPTVDLIHDIRREGMTAWWFDHRLGHILAPIIELAPRPHADRNQTQPEAPA